MSKLTLTSIFALVLSGTVVWMTISEVVNGGIDSWPDQDCIKGNDLTCIRTCMQKYGGRAIGYCSGFYCHCMYTYLNP